MKEVKTFHIITIGCQMNKSDSERIAGYLEGFGCQSVATIKKADIVIMTTCGVRQSAESRIYGLSPKIKKENPRTSLVVTGCLSERADVIKRLGKYVDVWLPIKDLASLASKIGITQKIDNSEYDQDYLKFSPKHNSDFSAYVPIGNGCNNYCTYCVVPYARGPEQYRDSQEIIEEVNKLIGQGYKEITLIAQNVNSYFSSGVSFPVLLRKINDIKGDFWLRFATSHPKDMSDELISVLAECDKICEHIHLPAQSGDNDILKAMNRGYTVEQYQTLVDKIKKAVPTILITTDIIVGFPGETDEQFKNTYQLFEYVKYDMAYIAQFSPRPGTVASKLIDDVNVKEKKRREAELMKILNKTSLENSESYLNKKVKVLFEGKNKKGILYGKTRTNKVVRIKDGDKNLLGSFVDVYIRDVKDSGLIAEILF